MLTPAVERITPGQLDQRVKLQRRAAGVDARGQPNGEWETVATVWAKVRPLRGRELFAAGQMQEVSDVEVTIRYRSDIRTSAWRLQWRGQNLDITAPPADIDGQRVWLQLLATSGVRDGLQ